VQRDLRATPDGTPEEDQNTGADDGDDELHEVGRLRVDAEEAQDEVQEQGAYDAEDDVGEKADIGLHDLFGDEPGETAEDDRHDDTDAVH